MQSSNIKRKLDICRREETQGDGQYNFKDVKSPGLYLSVQVKYEPCLQSVLLPQRSLVTTVSLTGESLNSQAKKLVEFQYVSGASHSPSDQIISG